MANPIKGEVPLEIGGKQYTFVLGTYGLAALERRMKMPFPRIFERTGKGECGIDEILAIMHAGLLKYHRNLNEEQVADLIDTAGLPVISKAINEAFELAVSATYGGSEPANPPNKATNGIGSNPSPAG